MTHRVLAVALFITAGVGTAHAAEKIAWEDLAIRLHYQGENRSFRVITKDGRKHQTRRLVFQGNQMRLFLSADTQEDLHREDVIRFEVRDRGRFLHQIPPLWEVARWALSGLPFDAKPSRGSLVAALIFGPPTVAFALAGTPVLIVLDAAAFFNPAKVYEIIP